MLVKKIVRKKIDIQKYVAYFWAQIHFGLPLKLKFCIEVLLNQTRSTSQQDSHQVVSKKCRG